MKKRGLVEIEWPDGRRTTCLSGLGWIDVALEAGVKIPTGCLTGSCGACEIDVNGRVVRACISTIKCSESKTLKVDFANDPYW